MSDPIDRVVAIEVLVAEANAEGAYGYVDVKTIVDCLTNMPSAESERKIGKWMVDKYGAEYCSECGKHPYNDGEYYVSGWWTEFCPHCGTRMEE